MKKLFDPSLIVHDKDYVALRDNPKFLSLKEYCENLWINFSPFADSSFQIEFANHMHERFWEMYLGNQLLKLGFELVPRTNIMGPDLHLIIDQKHVWIEATVPDDGHGDDAVPDIFNNSRFGEIPEKEIVLRFTNSISTKMQRFKDYVREGIIGAYDACVIAINGGKIDILRLNLDASPIPAIVKSVFPIGEHVVTVDINKLAVVHEEYKHRGEVVKISGSTVSTKAFLDSEYSGISGALYSEVTLSNLPDRPRSEFLYIHNYVSTVPIDKGLIRAGKEYWVEGDQLKFRINQIE